METRWTIHDKRICDRWRRRARPTGQGARQRTMAPFVFNPTPSLRSGIAQIWNEQQSNASHRWQQDSDRNLYNLFNAATEHLTHGVETSRFEYAGDQTESVTKKINRLVHNPEELKKAKIMTEDAELLMAVTN